jgi:hypothetical protein
MYRGLSFKAFNWPWPWISLQLVLDFKTIIIMLMTVRTKSLTTICHSCYRNIKIILSMRTWWTLYYNSVRFLHTRSYCRVFLISSRKYFFLNIYCNCPQVYLKCHNKNRDYLSRFLTFS